MGDIIAWTGQRDLHVQPVPAVLEKYKLETPQASRCRSYFSHSDITLAVGCEHVLHPAKEFLKRSVSSACITANPL